MQITGWFSNAPLTANLPLVVVCLSTAPGTDITNQQMQPVSLQLLCFRMFRCDYGPVQPETTSGHLTFGGLRRCLE